MLLDWYSNGNTINGVMASLLYDWDNKLRSVDSDGNETDVKYDPHIGRFTPGVPSL